MSTDEKINELKKLGIIQDLDGLPPDEHKEVIKAVEALDDDDIDNLRKISQKMAGRTIAAFSLGGLRQ